MLFCAEFVSCVEEEVGVRVVCVEFVESEVGVRVGGSEFEFVVRRVRVC